MQKLRLACFCIQVVSSCNYRIRSVRHIRQLIDDDTANTPVCSTVITRLDYCNALLYGVTNKNIYHRIENLEYGVLVPDSASFLQNVSQAGWAMHAAIYIGEI